MFELTLSIKLDKQKFLIEFQKKLSNELDKNFASIVSHIDGGKYCLAISRSSKFSFLPSIIP